MVNILLPALFINKSQQNFLTSNISKSQPIQIFNLFSINTSTHAFIYLYNHILSMLAELIMPSWSPPLLQPFHANNTIILIGMISYPILYGTKGVGVLQ
jgi:hypothetical protein